MQLVIHAGIHRTGTTSLQRFLAANRAALAGRGVAYPGRGGEQPPAAGLGHHPRRAGPDDVLALAAEAAAARLLVLSGEDFSVRRDLGWVRRVAERSTPAWSSTCGARTTG